uniref:Cytochrome c oxidase subunit 2 n=1 Tax=Cyriopagopus hainanus TaxID=2781057 RepID=A0A7M1IC28_CYRHA|nr:cytochrome c oxidase subunit II [Cyriopagopus hainanus]QOQ36836.1 cytochrome c oxidase subunit II [Cyriopagopus hainanus]
MPVWGSLYFQNASSPVMEQLIFFHDHVMVILIIITVLVGYMLMKSMLMLGFNRWMSQGQELESVWTVLPGVFLLVIAFPSLSLLYMMEEMDDPELTLKSTGRQWYWVYEYADLGIKMYESYMIPDSEINSFRLVEVDNSLVVPSNTGVRMIISSGDVIHSWTIPALGVSADGIPGRLNQVLFMCKRPGIYIGQCSEICGANHSFMPIVMEVVSKKDFLKEWF